jgi:hypothetical protein
MIEKKKFKRDYINVSTKYRELNNNSTNILNITFMPELFTAGKNLFRFKPNPMFISEKFPINIEVLDKNGKPIYHEVLRKKERDKSINVAVYVYDSVPIGECSITILSTVYRDLNGILLPNNAITKYNYKYIHTLSVDKTKVNDSEIIYKKEPTVTLEEKKFSVIEEKFNTQKPSGSIGFATYSFKDSVPTLTNFSNDFRKEFEGGKIFFSTLSSTRFPSAPTASFEYSSSIVAVINPNQLILKDPVYFSGTDGTYRPVSSIENQEYNISYNNIADSRTVTQNVKSYAKLDISNLEPEVGNVSRIKVFVKSANRPNQAYEFDVNNNNWLVDPDSNLIEDPIGTFTKNVDLNFAGVPSISSANAYNYWKPISVNGAPPATIGSSSYQTSDYVFDSISVVPLTPMSGLQEIILEQTGSAPTQFYKDTVYKVAFDYYNADNILDTREKKIAVYVSGSAFRNNTEYGRYLGKVPTYTGAESVKKDFELRIPVDENGTGVLRFMMRDGAKLANIRTLSDSVYGFTPNRTRLYVPIDQSYKNEYLDFKIQYFNDTLKESQVSSSIEGVFFTGGNQYIYGDDNIITGSTFLSSYTASGIQLFSNISGSKSGSAIQTYGYGGIEYALSNTPTSYNYGWSLTQGNPYASSSYSQATIQMINEAGNLIDFRANSASFDLVLNGVSSSLFIGTTGSIGTNFGSGGTPITYASSSAIQSFVKWDGSRVGLGGPIVTNLEFQKSQDPDLTGQYVSSSFIFVSSSNTSLGVDLYFRQNGNISKFKWFEATLNTGVLYGGTLSYNGSTLYVKEGSGVIVNHSASFTTEVSPQIQYIKWNDITSSITNIATQQNTFVYIDSAGNLQQQNSMFTPTQYHNYIPLGRVSHYDNVNISGVGGLVETTYDVNGQQNEFIRAFGPLKLSGMTVSGQPATLRLNVSSGTSFNLGGFYLQNPEMPSTYDSSNYYTSSIIRIYRSGSAYKYDNNGGSYYTTIDPVYYDNGSSVLQAVGNNNWTVQRVFFNPISGRSHVYYGQAKYTTLANAINGVASEQFSESDITSKSYVLVGYLAVLAQTTDLTNTTENTIVQAGLFRNSGIGGGGGGTGASSLAALTDVSLGTLSNAEVLKYNSTSGKWENSTVTTASYSVNSATASYLLNGGANIKADIVDGASFTGSPRTSTVTFPSPYEDNFYSVSISAESARAWTIESKTLSGFTINSNASDIVSGDVYWMTMPKSSSFIATRDIVTSASYAATASYYGGTVATASWAINFTGVAVSALSATSASYSATASSLSNSGGNITIDGGTTYDKLYFGGTLSQSIESTIAGADAGAVNLYFGSTTGFRDYRFSWQNDRNVVLYGAGGIAIWNTGTATSDYILKRNIKPTNMNGIDTLKKINVIDFQWKEDTNLHDGGIIHTGFVAQEVENVIPDAVYSPSGSTKLLHKEELVPTLVKALQEAVHRIEELEKRLLVSNN